MELSDAIEPDPSNSESHRWLLELLLDAGLSKYYSKLTNDLQVTKLAHFDYVSEDDLIQIGLSKPAARRLLAAVRKRKSFVTYLKNRFVNKLLPSQSSNHFVKKHSHSSFSNNTTSFPLSPQQSNNVTSTHGNSDPCRLSCLINSKDIQVKEDLGRGVHGFVRKGEWTAPNGRVIDVALKVLRKDAVSDPGSSFNELVKEISVMHQLNHPNIIQLYGVVLSSPMMMVTELAPLGNLRDWLRKGCNSTPISQLINFGYQISQGMQYLESRRFVHRDLAARNVFLGQGRKVLIGDLGLMRSIPNEENHYVMSERTKIPYPWCAPESLKFKQFSSKSDVYMFGVTLWEIFSFGKEPWLGLNLTEILEKISTKDKRLPCPDACPSMVYQTMLQCWNVDFSDRPDFSALFQYLSTSYPLEVQFEGISKLENTSKFKPVDVEMHSKLLKCQVNDRILVIDGQPEKYWWKGQNQRSFEIGWFALSSTKWLTPKRIPEYISLPLKNSCVHTGHLGQKGRWGDPAFIDPMFLKNPMHPDDVKAMGNCRLSSKPLGCRQPMKSSSSSSKAKKKLSRLFGMNGHLQNQILPPPSSYNKFTNDLDSVSNALMRTRLSIGGCSGEGRISKHCKNIESNVEGDKKSSCKAGVDDGPPLIDLSDDTVVQYGKRCNSVSDIMFNSGCGVTASSSQPRISLIDMEDFPEQRVPIARPRSATNVNRSEETYNEINEEENYNLSCGSWNTGTFDGTIYNEYSAYYCPPDEAAAGSALETTTVSGQGVPTSVGFEHANK